MNIAVRDAVLALPRCSRASWRMLVGTALVALCASCAPAAREGRPTPPPIVFVTAAPTQDISGTATAYARKGIPTPTPGHIYVVRPGDTLTKIADDHETTIDELMTANNLSDPNKIEVGQVLRLPQAASTAIPLEQVTATP